jgi:hypothetical protein
MNKFMQVFGWCVETKVVHEARLFISDVVEQQIHPWLVDVFDPTPVILKMYGIRLAFTRLCKLSLSFTIDRTAWLLVLDHELALSLIGTYKRQEANRLVIDRDRSQLSNDPEEFKLHLTAYLGVHKDSRSHSSTPTGFICIGRGSDDVNLGLKNRTIRYANNGPYPGHRFGGQMFDLRRFRFPVPPEIERVFNLFSVFHPIVFGPALRRIVCGQPVDNVKVDFVVDDEGRSVEANWTFYKGVLQQLGASQIVVLNNAYWKSSGKYASEKGQIKADGLYGFRFEGTNYRLFAAKRIHQVPDVAAHREWRRVDFSVHQLECECPGEIMGSRIALWDLGRKQARLLTLSDQYDDTMGRRYSRMKDQLRNDGINIVNVLWHRTTGAIINNDAAPDGIYRSDRRRLRPHDYP